MTTLPIIDISDLVSRHASERIAVACALDHACATSGFLYIKGDQIDWTLFRRMHARAITYFAQDEATKMGDYIGRSQNHSGYVPVGEEQFGGGISDLKEAYDVNCDYSHGEGRRPLLGPNLWPEMAGFREDVAAYYAHGMSIGGQLFRAFALALGLAEDFFDAHRLNPPRHLRLIHYPHDDSAEDRPGIGAHTDYECFTLLFATAPGLQIVDRQGAWIDVPLVDEAMIMNVGDMMEILSNGRYRATTHRVKKVRQERYSFPMFHACDYDFVIAPVAGDKDSFFAPLKGGEHLFNQTAQTFAYLKRRVASGELILAEPMPLHSFGQREAE